MSAAVSPDERVRDVAVAYDRAAERWRASRTDFAGHLSRFLDLLTASLPPGASVLDVGCGCGVPVARNLVERGFRVTGLEISRRLVEFARRDVPGATFILGDIRTADPGGSFDALVVWDSVFHIPRGEHAALLRRFRSWLRPSGRLLVSFGGSAWEGTSEMLGETFFYSGYEPEESLRLLAATGFRVLYSEIDDPSSRGHIAVIAAVEPVLPAPAAQLQIVN